MPRISGVFRVHMGRAPGSGSWYPRGGPHPFILSESGGLIVVRMRVPKWRVGVDQQRGRLRVRVAIGPRFRLLEVSDARRIADKIHDTCDRIEELRRRRDERARCDAARES